jgi:hypothetical protein
MKGKTAKSLLIVATITATILTGCGSKDTESEIESETTTVEETTEVETSTIEETPSESETTTTEVETSTIEETTTEEETSIVEETTTDVIVKNGITFAGDADEADLDQIMKAVDADVQVLDICDNNRDGIISKEEAKEGAEFFDDAFIEEWKHTIARENALSNSSEPSSSASPSTTTPSTSSSTSTLEEREDKTDPNNFIKWGTGDMTGASDTVVIY